MKCSMHMENPHSYTPSLPVAPPRAPLTKAPPSARLARNQAGIRSRSYDFHVHHIG